MKRETKVTDAVQKGREAFGRRAWSEAYAQLSAADNVAPLGIDDLERLATSAHLIGKDEICDDLWVRAHNECILAQDVPRAVRFTFWLINDLMTRGKTARAGGWLTRSLRLLEAGGHDCSERGLLLIMTARLHLKQRDMQAAHEAARQAVEIGDRFNDPELRALGRLMLGQLRLRKGETAKAVSLFDEVMVAVTVGDVSPVAIGTVYCIVIDACHQTFDLQRAREWTAELSIWCSSQPDLVPFRGQCLVHRAEIMRLSGEWSQALVEARNACTMLSEVVDRNQSPPDEGDGPSYKYPVGAAFYELGELHRVHGDIAKATAAYRNASRCGQSPEPGLSLLQMAQGRLKVAEAAIRRVLGEPQNQFARINTLAAGVEIMIAVGDFKTARAHAVELAAIAAGSVAPFLRALSAQSMGAVLLAEGDARAALEALRTSWMIWQELDAPYDAARVRVLLGSTWRALGDDDAAELELDAALRVFERLAAAADVTRVKAVMETASDSDGGELTPRELEVIGLLATGKTNRVIARQLSISERTVDRHVSNILMKLDLSSRSAATAYAYEHGLV